MLKVRGTCIALAVLLAAGTARAAESAGVATRGKGEVTGAVYPAIQFFNWREYDGGDELLEEDGPLLAWGGYVEGSLEGRVRWKAQGEVYRGEVDYDGATWEGVPVKSTTSYSGSKVEGALTFNVRDADARGPFPFAGVGLNSWHRDLEGEGGYDEYWTTIYGLLGVRITAPGLKDGWFGSIALRAPIYNKVKYDFGDLGGMLSDVELEPGRDPSLNLEAGFQHGRVRIALAYEQMNFAEDKKFIVPDSVLSQPESKARILGISAGIAF